jgi:phosphinothricin acetyltransferase
VIVREATRDDLPAITAIYNHYVVHSHVTFDVSPFSPEQRVAWFHGHSDGARHRTVVAVDGDRLIGYAASGMHRKKPAYDTTVELTIQCAHDCLRGGTGTRLYTALFELLARQDVHRMVAGIAQPNEPSNALHARFGFELIGTFTEVGFKLGRYWDVRWWGRSPLAQPDPI